MNDKLVQSMYLHIVDSRYCSDIRDSVAGLVVYSKLVHINAKLAQDMFACGLDRMLQHTGLL